MTQNKSNVYVSLEFTPNPNTLKYAVNLQLLDRGAANFVHSSDAQGRSPLAEKLFSVAGISSVMIGKDFVTMVTKSLPIITLEMPATENSFSAKGDRPCASEECTKFAAPRSSSCKFTAYLSVLGLGVNSRET